MVSEIATSVERSVAKMVHAVSRKSKLCPDKDVSVTEAVGHAPADGTLLEIPASAETIGEAAMPL
jgi:hypothetical protein